MFIITTSEWGRVCITSSSGTVFKGRNSNSLVNAQLFYWEKELNKSENTETKKKKSPSYVIVLWSI